MPPNVSFFENATNFTISGTVELNIFDGDLNTTRTTTVTTSESSDRGFPGSGNPSSSSRSRRRARDGDLNTTKTTTVTTYESSDPAFLGGGDPSSTSRSRRKTGAASPDHSFQQTTNAPHHGQGAPPEYAPPEYMNGSQAQAAGGFDHDSTSKSASLNTRPSTQADIEGNALVVPDVGRNKRAEPAGEARHSPNSRIRSDESDSVVSNSPTASSLVATSTESSGSKIAVETLRTAMANMEIDTDMEN
ncbi:hypothetical protein C8R44DRAFT_982579 [Mycena epipterygia]|nr:hypothetical protein C8R44DRAFT_982579 [Mycena epipterygia]